MSNWVVNANTTIPFSGILGSSAYPYVHHGDQKILLHGQTVAPEGYAGRGLSGASETASPRPTNASSWSHENPAASMLTCHSKQPAPGQHALISGVPDTAAVQVTPKEDFNLQNLHDLERQLQSARAQAEQHQQEVRIMLTQMESLTSELASERQRSDEVGRQLLTVSVAHQALQVEHQRLLVQHATVVREHEHMTSSQAAAIRELEARHADISRLQRQLEEAQAAVAAASTEAQAAAEAQQADTAAPQGGASRPAGQRSSTPPPLRPGGHAAVHLSAADEERWALRLHKAERALEEERRVSEDLRQRLKATETESRAMQKKMQQLESELDSPARAAMLIANSDPLPRSPGVVSPVSLQLPPLGAAPSGLLHGVGSGPPSVAGATIGRAASAGSSSMGGAKPGSAFASAITATASSGGAIGSGSATPHLMHPHEEQVARLKREVDGLRSDLSRLATAEEMHRVAERAAEDRARAAELVSLDIRRQCDQAARTIGRLIEENSELVAKVNAQANALADCRSTAASKEAMLRNLEARLMQAQAQLVAAQAHDQQLPHLPSDPAQQQQQTSHPITRHHHHLSNGRAPPGDAKPPGDAAGSAAGLKEGSGTVPHTGGSGQTGGGGGSVVAPPGAREMFLPVGPLTETDWKLVMLAEEVRRLVEEVSLSTTACLAMQLKSQCEHQLSAPQQQQQQQQHATGLLPPAAAAAEVPEQASSVDLPRILSRLEGLAGRRPGPGETAAYIIELAGHMEALEQVLQAQRRRMAMLRGEMADADEGVASGPGSTALTPEKLFTGGVLDDGLGAGTSDRTAQNLQQQQQAGMDAGQTQNGVGEQPPPQGQVHNRGEATAAVAPVTRSDEAAEPVQDSIAAFAAEALEAGGSSWVPARDAAFGSFVDHSGSGGQLQPPTHTLPPITSPQPPLPPPPSHHIVSPFTNLVQRKDSQLTQPAAPQPHMAQALADATQQQQQSLAVPGRASGDIKGSVAAAAHPAAEVSIDYCHTVRCDLAAAAAAAVAAVTTAAAATVEADTASGAAAATPTASMHGIAPVVLLPYEVPSSPRAAPAAVVASAEQSPQLTAVVVGVDVTSAGAGLLEDEMWDEVATGRARPRRAGVGLWGWISGESVR